MLMLTRGSGQPSSLVLWNGYLSSKASVQQIVDFFVFMKREKGPSVPAVKGYRVVLNHIVILLVRTRPRILSNLSFLARFNHQHRMLQ